MPTLKEIKARIGSVQSTLKITSAMKLVSSAKLRKAQHAIEAMRPYEQALQQMLAAVSPDVSPQSAPTGEETVSGKTVIVAMASNSSLCGGFNANVIAQVSRVRRAGDTVISIGRKMADAMRRDGFPSPEDYTALADHPAYAPAARLVECLSEERAAGHIDRVLLVYNHYVSAAKQVPVVETLLSPRAVPQEASDSPDSPDSPAAPAQKDETPLEDAPDIILEPGREALLDALVPKTLKLKLFAALLDSAAAEHAARTVAMQTASDNAENLLAELTLQYNKGRQQKITSEILDLAGGQIEA